MKELTAGNDKIEARGLYQEPFYYKPQFKIILQCNNLPKIPARDEGTWRRLRVTPWKTKFVDGPLTEPFHEPKDDTLVERMQKWGPRFIWLLINVYYPLYNKPKEQGGGLQEPEEVTKYTNNYKKKTDVYMEFLDEYIKKTDDLGDEENVDIIYKYFKGWHRSSYDEKAPVKNEFVDYLKTAKYNISNGMIKGVKYTAQVSFD